MAPISFNPNTTPVFAPPPGVIPNFINPPESLGPGTLALCIAAVALTFIMVVGRLYNTFSTLGKLCWDDYTVLVALVFLYSYIGLTLEMNKFAVHGWNVPVAWLTPAYQAKRFSQEFSQIIALFFAKLSLFLLYLRVFTGTKRSFKLLVYAGIAFTLVVYGTRYPVEIVFCAPVYPGEVWGTPSVDSRCATLKWGGVVYSALNLVIDIYLFVLPVPVLWKLNLPMKRKIGVMAIFLTGFLAVGASIVGIYYRIGLQAGSDFTWGGSFVYIAIIVETAASIFVSCMPGFAALLKTYIKTTAFLAPLRSKLLDKSQTAKSTYKPRKPSLATPLGTRVAGADHSHAQLNRPRQESDDAYFELGHGSTHTHNTEKYDDNNVVAIRTSEEEMTHAAPRDGGINKTTEMEVTYHQNPLVIIEERDAERMGLPHNSLSKDTRGYGGEGW